MIAPPVWGSLKYNWSTYIFSSIMFVIAGIISASTIGLLCGFLGALLITLLPLSPFVIFGFILCTAIIYGFFELFGLKLPIPTRHWQVPKEWRYYGMPVYATAFGLILGAGFLTIINSIGYYILLAICVAEANPLLGSSIMALYGASRTVPILLAPVVLLLKRRTYTFETACSLSKQISKVDSQVSWVRAVVFVAIAGFIISEILSQI